MTDLIAVLAEMKDGRVLTDCNKKFNEMLTAVFETGKKGELTLKVKVKPSRMAVGGAVLEVETEHDCNIKKPELSVGHGVFFVSKDGRLLRDDPAQTDMFEQEQQEAAKRG